MFTIKKDGKVASTQQSDASVYDWMHNHAPYSVDHAVRYEGYTILDSLGQDVSRQFMIDPR